MLMPTLTVYMAVFQLGSSSFPDGLDITGKI